MRNSKTYKMYNSSLLKILHIYYKNQSNIKSPYHMLDVYNKLPTDATAAQPVAICIHSLSSRLVLYSSVCLINHYIVQLYSLHVRTLEFRLYCR